MQRATIREHGEEYPIDVSDLREDVRLGRVSRSAELLYPPWTGEAFQPIGAVAALADELDAPGALLAERLSTFSVPWLSVCVSLLILGVAAAQFAGYLPDAVEDAWGRSRFSIGYESVLFERAWWAHLTSQFVHASPLHALGNLAAIGVSGWRVERALGATAYAVIAAASVLVGALVVVAICPLPVIGSSTLGFGLLAAHVAIGFRLGDALPPTARGKYGFGVLPVFLFILLPTLTLPAVAHSAHFGGLVGGGLVAMLVPVPPAAPAERRPTLRLANLGLCALLLGLPAALNALLVAHPRLVLGVGQPTEVERTGVVLRLPWRIARNDGTLLGAKAWSTSPGSPDALFGGINRARSLLDPMELARTWERGAELELLESPEPLGPGWLATAFHRRDGAATTLIVEHQQLRGTTLIRLGYMAQLPPEGGPSLRARLFEDILRTAELGDPPLLAQARRKFADFPEIESYREELGRQLYLVGEWAEAETVLAPLIDPDRIQGSDALRIRLDVWANHPDAVRAAHPADELDPSWLDAVLDASVSQRYYQTRGIRAQVAFHLCLEASESLARFADRRPDAPELDDLREAVASCGDQGRLE